ncbi:MAG: DUF4159 domain-containing protein [Cryomorphaceae bacterium]|nr:MAG: DUF4159 domain-containing protein [Cryomorphaceae bacterium]
MIIRNALFLLCLIAMSAHAQKGSYQFAVLKYKGGGDWYSDPTAVPNLVKFCNEELGMHINEDVAVVEVGSPDLFNYPFVHMTGHGNVVFSASEAENLRTYLESGGFLHIDDNYGMDPFIRPQLERVFPDQKLVELPFNHPIYSQRFHFPDGLPKIHEHDGKPPQGFGLFHDGRLVLYYTYETDLSDGWEDAEVHGNTEETRLKSLKMGANIVQYVFNKASLN